MQYREDIGHVVVATMSEHQTSCSVEYGLKASLEIGRKSDKHKVAVVEPRSECVCVCFSMSIARICVDFIFCS